MSERILTQARLKELFNYDPETGMFTRLTNSHRTDRVGKSAGSRSGNYHHISINKVYYQSHNLAWLYVHGRWPKCQIDHIDRNGLNNRIDNLREVSCAENQHNLGMNVRNKSGVSGVSWCSRTSTWVAQISANKKTTFLGRYKDFDEAVQVRAQAKRIYHPTAPI